MPFLVNCVDICTRMNVSTQRHTREHDFIFKLCIRPGAQGLVHAGHWKGLGAVDIPCRSNYRLLLIIYTSYLYSLQEHSADLVSGDKTLT